MSLFPFNVYFGVLIAGVLGTALSFPLWNAWCARTGHVDDPGARKIHNRATPLSGGPAVMTGIFAPILLGVAVIGIGVFNSWDSHWQGTFEYGLSRRAAQLIVVLGGALGMVILGWLDDHYELKPLPKFAGQVLIALAVAWSGIRVTLFIPSDLASYALTVLWILTITNAMNFLDNMNGLCAGLGSIAAWTCAWAAAIQGQYLVATLAFLVTGALFGFLPFNFPEARAFLGDAGSHLTGFLVAVLAIMPNFFSAETPNMLAVLSPLLILAVPLFDLVSVVMIRWRNGQPFYIGDTNHISHRLVRRGFNRTTAVLLILAVHALCSALATLILIGG